MQRESAMHPNRFPLNAQGDFYTIGQQYKDGTWCGECLSCGAPEALAPTTLSPLTEEDSDTYFLRQPATDMEIMAACEALDSCCVDALRYGGRDPRILSLLRPSLCDHPTLWSRFSLIRRLVRFLYWKF